MTLTQLEAFALTLAIEGAVAAAVAWRLRSHPITAALAAAAGSAVTHPILWAIYPFAHDAFAALTTPALEAVVIAAETLAYRAIATRRWDEAALLSLLANAASWGLGEVIYAL